jgi:hypothetical protein
MALGPSLDRITTRSVAQQLPHRKAVIILTTDIAAPRGGVLHSLVGPCMLLVRRVWTAAVRWPSGSGLAHIS